MTIKSIFVAIVVTISTPIILAESKTELLPEVKEILAVKFDEKNIEDNAYVALLAINAPEGLDYKEIGKKTVIAINKQIREAIAKQDANLMTERILPESYFQDKTALTINMVIDGERYDFPCSQLDNQQCLSKLIKDQAKLEALFISNRVLLTRYSEIIKLSNFNTPPAGIATPIPSFKIVLGLSRLRLSKAVFLINKGKVEEGLDLLQQEIIFAKRVLTGNKNLIDLSMAVRQILTTYHVVSELLDSPQLANQLNNPKLLVLLKPLTLQEQQALVNAFINERNLWLRELSMYSVEQAADILNIDRIATAIKETNFSPAYNRAATLNTVYKKFQPIIKMAKISLPQASDNYITNLKDQVIQPDLTVAEIYQQYGAENFIGGVLVDLVDPKNHQHHYIKRFYDVNNYLTLVNVKLQIKQVNITKEQVPSFLTTLGEKASNRYTKNPFIWDIDTQTLSSEWLGHKGYEDGEQASVYIQFN